MSLLVQTVLILLHFRSQCSNVIQTSLGADPFRCNSINRQNPPMLVIDCFFIQNDCSILFPESMSFSFKQTILINGRAWKHLNRVLHLITDCSPGSVTCVWEQPYDGFWGLSWWQPKSAAGGLETPPSCSCLWPPYGSHGCCHFPTRTTQEKLPLNQLWFLHLPQP